MADTIRIATVNCQGLNTPSKRKDVLNFYKSKGYSIICLQDTHFTENLEPFVETQWGYKCVFNSFSSNSRGVAVLFNNNFELKLHRVKRDEEGNVLALDLNVDENRLTLINIYGPNSDNPEFYEKIRDIFLELDNDYYILCGDFNIALDQELDTFNYSAPNNPKAREKLLEVMNDLHLIDYYRILNPGRKIYTWRRKNPVKQGRIDYILVSENLTNIIEKLDIKSGYRSDHSVVVSDLRFNSFERGRGLWKFNCNLLHDKTYVDKVKQKIKDFDQQYLQDTAMDIDCSSMLEILLMEIRGMTISYSSFKKREKDKEEKALISDIEILESEDNNKNQNLLEEKKASLEQLRKQKLQGHMVRSRARWVEEGEKPTKYFCHLESRNFLNKTIKKVETPEKILYNQLDIMNEVRRFYQSLYQNTDTEIIDVDLADILTSNDIPKLENNQICDLEKNIDEHELLSVLKNMKNNKSPGSDGFTVEFFKFFWSDLKGYITKAVQHIFLCKHLPISQRLGIISCLPKGDKPRQFLKNWRPITLLNVFYKIISGCIGQRIKSTLDVLISDTQTGFRKGRYIGENTRFIFDLMSYTELKKIPGLLVLIDFEKAFDSISWSFIYKVLQFFGFGENIISWIKIINTGIKASVLQSGFLSEQFDVQRGCRQGDPVAPYLFLLCAEILAILIERNKDIKGIIVNDKEYKISQFADDTSLTLDGSEKSLHAALDTLDYFGKLSGLKVNCSKTKVIWIGSKKFSAEVFHHARWKLDWGCTTFTLLGIHFSVVLDKILDLNYDLQIPKIYALIQQWKRRVLTPIGRVTVAKTLILPKLNHLFISLSNPKHNIISLLTKELFKFIWGSQCDKVKRSTVTQKYTTGGLNMVDLKHFLTSLKCSWIKRLVSGGQSWIDIFESIYGCKVVKNLLDFGDDYVMKLMSITTNDFWKNVLESWLYVISKLMDTVHANNSKILCIPIWYNTRIKVDKKSLFVKVWYEKGVKIIDDFLDEKGYFLSKEDFAEKYNIEPICCMKYNSVISAISTFMKGEKFSREHYVKMYGPFFPLYFRIILQAKKTSQYIYRFINTSYTVPKSFEKWKSLHCYRELHVTIQDVFKNCFMVSKDSKVQWLQYRILHRILPVKYYLKKIKILDDDICSFCNSESETIEHIFFSCTKVISLWNSLSLEIYNTTAERVGFNKTNVIFGELPFQTTNAVINFLIIFTKQYIFYCAKNKKCPHIKGLVNHLRTNYTVEKIICLRHSCMKKFDLIWAGWTNFFEVNDIV
jgi:exonuclease III